MNEDPLRAGAAVRDAAYKMPATPPPSAVAVTMNPGASPPAMLPMPRLVIGGRDMAVAWGRTVVPVPPGHHQVQAYLPHLLSSRSNLAAFTALVAAGWVTELEYRCSMWTFGRAWLGLAQPPQQPYQPQRWGGQP